MKFRQSLMQMFKHIKNWFRKVVETMAVVYATLIIKGKKTFADVPDKIKEQVKQAIESWQAAHAEADEYIEVVVNNAGIRRDNVMALMPSEDWLNVINTNLNSFFAVTQPLISQMQFHKFGRIINMASVSGIMGMQGQTNYSAAKGGIIAATKALAKEVARKNITVNAVAPGFIKTDMVDGLDEAALKKTIPANRFGKPEEVAALVGFLVTPEAGYITGNVISINGGLYT